MPVLTNDQLSALARTGAGNNEIEAVLRRAMTPEEKQVVMAARAAWKADRAVKRSKTKLASSDRQRLADRTLSRVDLLPCADPDRRARLEADPVAWLMFYLSGTYTRPFERPHIEIVSGAVKAHESRGRFVVAAERGIGKSAILWGMILYFVLSGKERYPVCVPWADKALKRAFRFWKSALCFNENLLSDYPEFCAPFATARGVAQRVTTRTCGVGWERFGLKIDDPCGCQLTVGEGMIVLPARLGCIGGSTINGNIRGLNHPQSDGTVLRPTMALLDDVQDRSTAKSPEQIADTCAIIDGDVAGCGEAGRDMPMLMACNCIQPGDVSEHYLAHPEWHALRVPCVERWPTGWSDKKSRCRELWEEWHDLFLSGKGDRTFYRKNHKAMTAGMKLSAPAAFAGAENCPDPFYGVMRMYHRMEHSAFMAERQQTPIDPVSVAGPYTLRKETIMQRTTKRAQCERPDWVTNIYASSDVNPSYALSTVVVGFGRDQTAAVLWYGIHPMSILGGIPAPEHNRQLFAALSEHGRAIAGLPCPPEAWAIDAGGTNFDGVVRFAGEAAKLCGVPALAFTGRGSKAYKPYGKTMVHGQLRERCHGCHDVKDGRHIRWVAWHADYWGEVAQKAWLGEVGAPGSVSLHDGNHEDFAIQITNKRLMGRADVGGDTLWNWHNLPGKQDFHDAMAQAYALAAFSGIGTGGQVEAKPKAKANIPMYRPSGRK
jgi:hypothetical protein